MAETQRDNRRWLVTAGVVVVLIVVAVFAFQSCRSDVSPALPPPVGSVGGPDTPPAAAPPATPATPTTTATSATGFVGTWTGKWDGVYSVQFTISQDPQDQQYQVVYEWEEVIGQPMKRREWPVKEQAGTLFTGPIEITLSPDDPNHAIAVGRFRKSRTAELTRQ
jgi:hypothetical protein